MWKHSLERIREMVRKEFLQLFRDPRMWAIVFVAPLLQLVIFGYAVSTDIRHTATFVVDNSRTPQGVLAEPVPRPGGCGARARS